MSPPPSAEPTLDDLVARDVLDLVTRGLPLGLAVGFVPLAVAATLLQVLAAPRHLAAWAAGVALALLLGMAVARRLSRQPAAGPMAARRRRQLMALTFCVGTAWGLAGWLFVPSPWQVEMVVLGLLLCLSAAIVADVGVELPCYAAYVVGTLAPTVVVHVSLGGALNLGTAAAALAMLLVFTMFAARLDAATRRSLRVGHENRRLAAALQERTHEAERANEARTRFFAAASHDLRQPVHALGLLLDLLHDQVPPPAQPGVQRAQRVLQSLDALFAGLLDVSRLDTGAVVARPAPLDLRPLLQGLADEFALPAARRGLALRLRAPPAATVSDPVLLERLLRNLLGNALRYTHRGGVLLACRRRSGAWSVEVWDTGIGIAPEHQAAVFEEFFQVGNPERARAEGLGLGLSIVRRLALLLGHAVDLRSRPGRGTCVRVQLPAAAPVAVAAGSAAATAPGHGLRHVLVVEDDAEVRQALVDWLQGWGVQVTAFADGAALSRPGAFDAGVPDALISDYRLPAGADGIELVALVRARLGRCLPALLVSGDGAIEPRRVASLSACTLLHKPVRPAALRAALSALVPRAAESGA